MNFNLTYLSLIYKSKFWLIIGFIIGIENIHSQTKDSLTHQLMEVTISETKQQTLQASKKSTTFDSLILERYNTTSLADLLSNQSAIHIKSYGNGNIATTSIRGGNASQTAVMWNGLNIQNPMLGQTDLSLIPTLLFENITLEYGGGSTLNGSGAMGGSIQLKNTPAFNKGITTKVQMSIGSFNTKKVVVAVQLSYKRVSSNTRIYYTLSQNNYNYTDTTDKLNSNKQVKHADYLTKGLLQELAFLITPNQTLNVRLWYNTTHRNLPSYTTVPSQQNQEDENLKLNADWNYSKRKIKSIIRLAFFKDALDYTDSLAGIYSKTNVRTLIGESDNTYTLKNHTFNIGANATSYRSDSITYDTTHTLTKLAFFAAYKLQAFQSKLNYNISIRKEFTNLTTVPFTGNTGIHYQIHHLIAAKINANSSFRQPTLNDLYWKPGGNPNLKPEQGYEIDGGLEFKYQHKKIAILFEGTYFNRHTTNWITWLPTANNYWSPQNIAEVYSRGTETKTELAFRQHDFFFKLMVNTSYVLSTNTKSKSENDNSVGRQLTYTPRYAGNMGIYITYKKASLLINQTYTGYRFVSTDNTTWLNPYYTANIKVSYQYTVKKMSFEFFLSINNVLNKNYAVVSNRPMPLRNFEAGIVLKYSKK
jgi:vitamin B12 transporter